MNKPLVSVVIPLYNKEKTVARAIDSVLAQTVQNFELIVAEGNSTDRSHEIITDYDDSRIIQFIQEGHGVSAARNQGIEWAHANLIAFLDADDCWMPDYLETVLKMYKTFPHAGMYGTAFSVFQNDVFVHQIILDGYVGESIIPSYFSAFVSAGHPIIITSGFAARKEILGSVGGFPENLRVGEDHELFGKIALQYPVAYSSKVCVQYNIDSNNNTDVVDYILEVPLESYLSRNQCDATVSDVALCEYLDHWRVRTGGRNIYSGYRKEGRRQLSAVTSKRYMPLKSAFMLLSLFPANISRLSPTVVRRVLRGVGLSI